MTRVRGAAVHLGVLVVLALLAFTVDGVPKGTVVAQGDYFQTVELGHTLSTNLFTWFHLAGQGQYNPLITTWPFYAVQRLLELAGLTDTAVASFLQFEFLALSYLAMVLACRLGLPLVGRVERRAVRVIAGLAYALNTVTFDIVSQSWGYLHHGLIYPALPLLLAVTWRLLLRPSWRAAAASALLLVVASVAFNNVAWFLVLALCQTALAIGAVVAREVRPLPALLRLAALGVGEALLSAYVLVPFLVAQSSYASKASTTVAFGGDVGNIIRQTSVSYPDAVTAATEGPYHFPGLDAIGGGGVVGDLSRAAALLPLGLAVWVLARGGSRRRVAGALVAYVVLVVLVARVEPPLGTVLLHVFSSGALVLLRSPEKVYVLLPFAAVLLCLVAARHLPRRPTRGLAVAASVLLALPFLVGGVPSYLGVTLRGDLTSQAPATEPGYRQAVAIPSDYRAAAAVANADPGDGPVVSVPYTSENSINWSNYPAWHFVGANLLSDLFRRPVVTADSDDHPTLETTLSFQQFDLDHGTPAQFLAQVERFGARYVLLHHDAPADRIAAAAPTFAAVKVLQSQGILTTVSDGPDVTLYRVVADSVDPPVQIPGGGSYRQLSPVAYDVTAGDLHDGDVLRLLQSEAPGWHVYALPLGSSACPLAETFATDVLQCAPAGDAFAPGQALSVQRKTSLFASGHHLSDAYANAWTVSLAELTKLGPRYEKAVAGGGVTAHLLIYYAPQSDFVDGLVLTLVGVLAALAVLVETTRRRRRAGA